MGQSDLRSVLSAIPTGEGEGDLLVGTATCDDAAVLRIEGDMALAQTVDFFTPIVDDPYVFGQIAAANSISDIYAMGARPILGLAIAAFPTDRLPLEVLTDILRGGADKAREAGFVVAGGHTIIDDVPKYGLVVTGTVPVSKLVRNSTASPGDALYLTKPIGNGILVSAHRGTRRKLLGGAGPSLDEAIRWMTMLSREAAQAMSEAGASAATDVTGYGLIGHLLEVCEASGVGAELHASQVPVLEGAREWLARRFRPEGTVRNLRTFRDCVRSTLPESELTLMCDAQTSGGLLIAVAPDRAERLERAFSERGLFCAKIGVTTADRGRITLLE